MNSAEEQTMTSQQSIEQVVQARIEDIRSRIEIGGTKMNAFEAYNKAADRVRHGDESPAALTALKQAEAAWNAERALRPKRVVNSLWDLPIAKVCWEADRRELR
jgi:hypothetical protein